MCYRTITGFKKVIRLAGKSALSTEEEQAAKALYQYLLDNEVWFDSEDKEKWQAMLEFFAILDVDPNSGMVFWQRKEKRERKHVAYSDEWGSFTSADQDTVMYFPFALRRPANTQKPSGSGEDQFTEDDHSDDELDGTGIEQWGHLPEKEYKEAVEKVPFVIKIFDAVGAMIEQEG